MASRGEPAPQHPRPCNRQQAGTGARGRCPWGDQRWGGEGGGEALFCFFFPLIFFLIFVWTGSEGRFVRGRVAGSRKATAVA